MTFTEDCKKSLRSSIERMRKLLEIDAPDSNTWKPCGRTVMNTSQLTRNPNADSGLPQSPTLPELSENPSTDRVSIAAFLSAIPESNTVSTGNWRFAPAPNTRAVVLRWLNKPPEM